MPKIRKNSVQNDVKTDRSTGKLIEQAQHLQTGIRVENLKKKYGRHTAVDGLTMNIYRNQITVLLGYNGAGKSTTMSMITGKKIVSHFEFLNFEISCLVKNESY